MDTMINTKMSEIDATCMTVQNGANDEVSAVKQDEGEEKCEVSVVKQEEGEEKCEVSAVKQEEGEEKCEVSAVKLEEGEEKCEVSVVKLEEGEEKGENSIPKDESTGETSATKMNEESCDETPTDEYHYTKTGEYTSEMFKVIVKNIPTRIPFGRFRAQIQGFLGFKAKKVKYNPSNPYAFLAFRNEEERTKALSALNDREWKSCKLTCKLAAPMKDPLVREKRRMLSEEEVESKRQKLIEDEKIPPEERIVKVVCPYASKPYDEQLVLKEQHVRSSMQRLTNKMIYQKIGCDWLPTNQSNEKTKLCLDLLPIIKSPVLNNYRNKVEFTIGTGIDGKGNTVGFRLGSYKEGNLFIIEPSKCINCSLESIDVAREFQEFIRGLPHLSYSCTTHKGFWQQLVVRTCTTDDVMVVIQVQPNALSEHDLNDVKTKIVDFFSDSERSVKVTSVFLSSSSQGNNVIDTFTHLTGEKYINERLLDLQFRISPDAFFQVNTAAAEVLYQTIYEWCDTKQENACVLDVCCGTGTIGLCLASGTSLEVTGIEISQQAVEDARHNAEVNSIKNANFVCGPAEEVIARTVRKIKMKNVIAVVDPPRAGIRRNVIETLRACSAIKKIIYVSCSPNQAADNLLSFCRNESKRLPGTPFRTVRAVPVDLFPHTSHCELIVELVRIDYDEHGASNEVQGTSNEVQGEASSVSTVTGTGNEMEGNWYDPSASPATVQLPSVPSVPSVQLKEEESC